MTHRRALKDGSSEAPEGHEKSDFNRSLQLLARDLKTVSKCKICGSMEAMEDWRIYEYNKSFITPNDILLKLHFALFSSIFRYDILCDLMTNRYHTDHRSSDIGDNDWRLA